MLNTAFPHSTGTDTPKGFVRTQMKMPLALGSSVPHGSSQDIKQHRTRRVVPPALSTLSLESSLLPEAPAPPLSLLQPPQPSEIQENNGVDGAAPTNPSKFHQEQLNPCSEFPFCNGQLQLYSTRSELEAIGLLVASSYLFEYWQIHQLVTHWSLCLLHGKV